MTQFLSWRRLTQVKCTLGQNCFEQKRDGKAKLHREGGHGSLRRPKPHGKWYTNSQLSRHAGYRCCNNTLRDSAYGQILIAYWRPCSGWVHLHQTVWLIRTKSGSIFYLSDKTNIHPRLLEALRVLKLEVKCLNLSQFLFPVQIPVFNVPRFQYLFRNWHTPEMT